jgi:release factor glutamine methyltransferase
MSPNAWTIKGLLKVSCDYLKKKQIDSPRLTAEVLLARQLRSDRMNLYLNLDQPLTEEEVSGYRALIRRRLQYEPLQYIIGIQEFWSIDFVVDPRALIPRPETELLVEHALRLLKIASESENQEPNILDLGTGCGILAVSLAKEVPNAQIWATDNSPGALELARLNAQRHGVSHRIQFREGDLWEPLMNLGITFDIILSNPPYVASEEYKDLPPEVRDYEPKSALDGGNGGTYYIERIITEAPFYMKPKAWILLEMAPDQTEKALALMKQIEDYGEKTRIRDYSRLYRLVMAQRA